MERLEFLNGIFAGYERATSNNEFLPVNSYDELKAIAEQQASKKAFASFDLCGGEYVAYMAIARPFYDVVLLVYSPGIDDNGRLVYEDELIQYHGTINERLEKMVNKAEQRIFSESEIAAAPLKDYKDYRAKWDFLLNYYPKKFGCVYAGYIHAPTPEQIEAAKNGVFCQINMDYFPEQWQVNHYTKLWNTLEQRHKKTLAENMDYFKQAAKYEMYNFECCYGGRYGEALAAIGIRRNEMTDEQQAAYSAAYREYTRETINA